MKITRKKYTYLGIVVILFLSVFLINFSEEEKNLELFSALKNKDAVSSLRLPANLTFANEEVPLNNFDTRESLERELIVNTYWHSQTILLIKRSKRYFNVIDSILKVYNVPVDFKYLAVAESGLAQVVSPSNAVGFWQFLEGTARDYGLVVNDMVDERYHVEKSTEAACKYLKESYEKFNSWTLAAASYNAGRRFVTEQMEQQKQNSYYDLLLGEEAERYVFRIIALKLVMENPNDYGFDIFGDGYQPIPYNKVIIDQDVEDFGAFAINHNTNYKLLKLLNPWLRKPYLRIENGKSYEVKIPAESLRKED